MIILSLDSWWELLTSPQKVFWVIAIFFTILFTFQFVMSLIGLDTDSDIDGDIDVNGDADISGDHGEHGYSIDPSFTILSIRGIISFFAFFGWTGVWLLGNGWGLFPATLISLASGFAAMFVVAYMIFQFSKLEKSGTMDLSQAIEEEGEVYLTIPAAGKGTGKVSLKLEGVYREFNAKSNQGEIKTGEKVAVIDILQENVLLVEPLLELPPGGENQVSNTQ